MTENTLIIVLVWLILVHVAIECVVHFLTWMVLRNQQDRSRIGPALRRRELALGYRHLLMLAFHLLLSYIVTYGHYPVPAEVRIPLYVMISLSAIIASVYGVNLIIRIRQSRNRAMRTQTPI